MGIQINTKELYEIFKITPANENIMLVGTHGIGKSQIITEYFSKEGIRVIPLFLGQMSDPGDLIGLPVRDTRNERTEFLPPYWFPKEDEPVVLFLDELNRARPEVLQTIMDLALNRRIAGRSLPEGSRIISAVNDGDEYQVTDLDPALVSRFNVYEFKPTVKEWLLWAEGKIDGRITDFIKKNPECLESESDEEKESCLEKSADRRGWEKVSHMIRGQEKLSFVYHKAICGVIGSKVTARFIESLNENKIISAMDLLFDFSSHMEKIKGYGTIEFAALNDAIFSYLENTQEIFDNKDNKKIAAENIAKYVNFLFDNDFREAIAHFISCFDGGLYNNAARFIILNANSSFKRCSDFIMSI